MEIENFSFYNETLEYLKCYNNKFYNMNIAYFNKFNDEFKNDLDNIIYNITNEIKKYKDVNNIINYFDENYELTKNIDVDKNEILFYFDNINSMILFARRKTNDEIKNFLNDLFVSSFSSSYEKLLNNFIIDELMENVTILINTNFEAKFDYLIKTIIKEYDYYSFILSDIKEIGINSKKSIINLYQDIIKKINDTMASLLEDKIFLNIDVFIRKNKNIFKDNFIDYYANNLNKYNININLLSDFIEDIFQDKNFNKTLDIISKELLENHIVLKTKNIINNSFENKRKLLNEETNKILIDIFKLLQNITTKELPEDMIIINELIINFTHILSNQKMQYLLVIGQELLIYYIILLKKI